MQYHISHNASFLGSLKKFAKVNKKRNNKFLYFFDNLTFGPLKNIFEENFLMQRSKWIYKNMTERDIFTVPCEFVNHEEDQRKEGKDFVNIEENHTFLEHKNFLENVKNIQEKDKIFIYAENTSESWLFISYFLNICNNKNIKIFFFKGGIATALNGEKYDLMLGVLKYDELFEIFRNGEILDENKRKFFQNIILNISEKNVLRILKNGKIKEVTEDFFDKKILENIKDKFLPLARIIGDFLGKNSIKDFGREYFFFWRIFELEKAKKVELKYKVEEYKHIVYKKMVRKRFYEIKKS